SQTKASVGNGATVPDIGCPADSMSGEVSRRSHPAGGGCNVVMEDVTGRRDGQSSSSQGEGASLSAETGQPPVAEGSAAPASEGEIEYEGHVHKVLYDKDAGTLDLITNGKPIHPE